MQSGVGHAEPLRVPGVDPGLVLGFDRDTQILKTGVHPLANGRFALFAQVGAVEVEQVVILDAGRRFAPDLQVPDRLEKTTRHQPGVGQLQRRQSLQDGVVMRVLQRLGDEPARQRVGRRGRLPAIGQVQSTLAIDAQT